MGQKHGVVRKKIALEIHRELVALTRSVIRKIQLFRP